MQTIPQSRNEAMAVLVERYVTRWGEGERAAAGRLVAGLSYGLLLNRLAYWDVEHVDEAMAAAARAVMTARDLRALRTGG